MPEKALGKAPFVFGPTEVARLNLGVAPCRSKKMRRWFDRRTQESAKRNKLDKRYWYTKVGWTVEAWKIMLPELMERFPDKPWLKRAGPEMLAQMQAVAWLLEDDHLPHGLALRATDHMPKSKRRGYALYPDDSYHYHFSRIPNDYKWLVGNYVLYKDVENTYKELYGELRYARGVAPGGVVTSGGPKDWSVFSPPSPLNLFPGEGTEDIRGDFREPLGEDQILGVGRTDRFGRGGLDRGRGASSDPTREIANPYVRETAE